MSDNILILAIVAVSIVAGFLLGSSHSGDSITKDCHNTGGFEYQDKSYKCEGSKP